MAAARPPALQGCGGPRRRAAAPRPGPRVGPRNGGKRDPFSTSPAAWPLLPQQPTAMPTPVTLPVEISFRITLDLENATFYDLQREVRREARQALLRALRTALGEVEKALLAAPILCPGCQAPMRSRGRTMRRIVTVFGSLALRRARYGCAACGTVRRPLDEWIGLAEGTEYTAAVREQVLYLSADLPYERAADVLRHVAGIGISGRQIQRLLEAESEHIEAAIGQARSEGEAPLRRRFRRAGRDGETAGAARVLQLRKLKTSGLWEQYWARRFRQEGTVPGDAQRPARGSR